MGQFQDQWDHILSRAHQDGTLPNQHNMVSKFFIYHKAESSQINLLVITQFQCKLENIKHL